MIRRIAVIAIFLLTTFVSKAQAAGTQVGFIPMFTHSSGNVPTVIQAGTAYNRMLPKLLALQKSGMISDFEPELNVGVVKVVYAAGGNLSTVTGMQSYSDINAAVAAVPQVKSAQPLALERPSNPLTPQFIMPLYESCLQADGLGGFDFVVGKLQDKNLRVVATFAGSASSSGQINNACFSWNGPYADITPGYRVTFNVYSDSSLATHFGGPYVSVIPAIKYTTIDKAHAVVGGKGPAGKQYLVAWHHANLNAANNSMDTVRLGTVSPAGTWSKDMSTSHFRGGDYLQLIVKQNLLFYYTNNMYVPYIYCELGGDFCSVNGFGGMPASLSIKHGGITYTRSGRFDPFGYFSEELMNNFDPIFLKAGDKAWGTSVPAFALPKLTTSVSFATNVVSGKAPPSKYFYVSVNLPFPANLGFELWTHSNSLGNYQADFTSLLILMPNTGMNFDVNYHDPSSGNITDFTSTYSPH